MILFKPEHVEMILNGTKTQTRRIWKRKRCNVGAIHKAKTKMFSKDYFAKIRILKVYQERLLSISNEDAVKEGYPTADAFWLKFADINAHKPFQSLVWVVEFELVKEASS